MTQPKGKQYAKEEVQEKVTIPEVWLDDLPKLLIYHTDGRTYRLEVLRQTGDYRLKEAKA